MVGDGLLLVTEAVANAVLRGNADESSEITMRVEFAAETVRVEVGAASRRFARLGLVREGSGLRLCIVDAVADRWEIDERDATRMWFELDGRAEDRGARHAFEPGVGV